MTAQELAQLVIEVMDAQKKYWKSRKNEDLVASKNLEKRLRVEAEKILALPAAVRHPADLAPES